jgi:hypothetical protein
LTRLEETRQNRDIAFKKTLEIFAGKELKLPGGRSLGIVDRVVSGEELIEIDVTRKIPDSLLFMRDGSGINFEFEAHVSVDDVRRFNSYSYALTYKFRTSFKTIVITGNAVSPAARQWLSPQCEIINLREFDAEEIITNAQKQLERGEAVNLLELMMIPLCKSTGQSKGELFKQSMAIAAAAYKGDLDAQRNIFSLGLMIISKDLNKIDFAKLKEETMMGLLALEESPMYKWILQEGMEKGIQEGMEKGKLETAGNALRKNMAIDDIVDLTGLPREKIEALAKDN